MTGVDPAGPPSPPNRVWALGWLAVALCIGLGLASAVVQGVPNPSGATHDAWWEAQQPSCGVTLAQSDHDAAIELAAGWLVRAQNPQGQFQPPPLNPTVAPSTPAPRRQAVAAVALARWARHSGDPVAIRAATQALEGWTYVATGPDTAVPFWPEHNEQDSAVLALLLLAHLELAPVAEPDHQAVLVQRRDRMAAASLRLLASSGRIHGRYDRRGNPGEDPPSTRADGAMLLAWFHASNAGTAGLETATRALAEATWQHGFERPTQVESDPLATKGLFPWGLEAFVALGASDWLGTESSLPRAPRLVEWMVEGHQMLRRSGNTAYALQGLAAASAEVATWDAESAQQLRCATDRGLKRLYQGQHGHPLSQHGDADPALAGAVQVGPASTRIRLDHVAHTLLAAVALRTADRTAP